MKRQSADGSSGFSLFRGVLSSAPFVKGNSSRRRTAIRSPIGRVPESLNRNAAREFDICHEQAALSPVSASIKFRPSRGLIPADVGSCDALIRLRGRDVDNYGPIPVVGVIPSNVIPLELVRPSSDRG